MKRFLSVIILVIYMLPYAYAESTNIDRGNQDSSLIFRFKTNGYKIVYEYGKPKEIFVVGSDKSEKLRNISDLLGTIVTQWEGQGLSGEVVSNNVKIFMQRFDYCDYCQ